MSTHLIAHHAAPLAGICTPMDLAMVFADAATPRIVGFDPCADNSARAAMTALPLLAHVAASGGESDDLGTAIVDLLGNLRHLADALEVDYLDLDAKAGRHYACELHNID